MPSTLYPICETFHSIQGEGLQTGTQAFFIRLSGCNLQCVFDDKHKCDEPLHMDKDKVTMMTMLELEIAARKVPGTLNIIITGGEPSLFGAISKMIRTLRSFGFFVAVETNGYKIDRLVDADLITYSPKNGFAAGAKRLSYEYIESLGGPYLELKVLANVKNPVNVSLWDDYPVKYVQPINFEDSLDAESVDYCTDFVTNNPDWRLSMQMHKVARIQ